MAYRLWQVIEMGLVFIGLPLFLALSSKIYSTPHSTQDIEEVISGCLAENPSILENALLQNPEILTRVFKQHPSIFWNAQHNMIENFSETVSHNVQKSTARIFKNSPELWAQIQKNPVTTGKKSIIIFLDPLCPHSIGLFRDLLALSCEPKTSWTICPHWITQHHDVNSQIIVRSLMASHMLGKLEAYLDMILSHSGTLSAGFALTLAKKIGCDIKEFHSHMFSADTDQYLMDSRSYGNQFQFPGFPTMIHQKEEPNSSSGQIPPFEIIEGRPDSLGSLAKMLSQ